MIFKILFYAFLLYLAYKLIFGFIIPVVRTTRKVKKGFREMREKMEQQNFHGHREPETGGRKDIPGEYIDYEEVKE